MSKKAKWSLGGIVILALVALVFALFIIPSSSSSRVTARFGVPSAKAAEPIGHIGTGPAADAIEKAGNADKYVFALFYRDNNDQLTRTRGLVESARNKISRKSETIEVNVTDPAEQDIVNRFGASRAPTPLVLVVAPNGAIMGGFPAYQMTDDAKLVDAVGCRASEQALKALQQKNMVALCVQSKKTADNPGAMRTVAQFLEDPKYGQTTAVVMADPTDPAEGKFVSKLGVDINSPLATTVMLAPPGTVMYTFQGGIPKDRLVTEVQAAASRKSGGCCPPGSGKTCGPTGVPTTPQKSQASGQPLTIQPKVKVNQTPTAPTSATAKAAPTTSTSATSNKQGK